MKALLLGSGGREHALAWKIARSPLVTSLHVLPGNDGITILPKTTCITGDAVAVARAVGADLVVVGPEEPMSSGVVDQLEAAGFATLGPSKAAAQLETSKIFSKEFMLAEDIPTAAAQTCNGYDEAFRALAGWDVEGRGVVIKADGLAAGKGVVVTASRKEAEETIFAFMRDPACRVKADRVLIEDVLHGREVSAFAICDGEHFVPLGYACDYKRLNDGGAGPNTGGMGGYTPRDWPSEKVRASVNERVFGAVLRGMKKRGTPFKGILFAGLMVDGEAARVLEFNVRFGDPETQVLMPLFDGDIVPLFLAAAKGELAEAAAPRLSDKTAVHVVMTSEGYPDTGGAGMLLGQEIQFPASLLAPESGPQLFIAGAKREGGVWRNTGGRVLGVTAVGVSLEEARHSAYAGIGKISFNGAHWRRDIGK